MVTRIFTPSDLQRRYRAVLDEARHGVARLRDANGESIVLLAEARLNTVVSLARAGANLAQIETARDAHGSAPFPIAEYGDWAWLRSLDDDDLRSFVADIRRALVVGQRDGATALLDDELAAWRITAEELDDPLRRQVLLGPVHADDFVPLDRPTAPVRDTVE